MADPPEPTDLARTDPGPDGGELARTSYPSTDRNPAAVYLASLARGSRRAMADGLLTVACIATGQDKDELDGDERRDLMATFPWHRLRYQHTAAIRAVLAERYRAATANKMLSALRGVLKQAWRLEYLEAESYHRAVDLPIVRGQTLLQGRALTGGELVKLFGTCENDEAPAGARDAALLAILYGVGLRRSEVVALDLADYNAEAGELHVHGKGNRDRMMPITDGTTDALEAWLHVRGSTPGPLFCPVNKGGRITIHRMTDQAVLIAINKRAIQGRVAELSPHDLRRSFITHLLDAGADALSVQKLAGHANTQTTLRYDRRDEKAKRKAVDLLHVPFAAA